MEGLIKVWPALVAGALITVFNVKGEPDFTIGGIIKKETKRKIYYSKLTILL